MSITLFSSCRLDRIKNHNQLNNEINYCHSTKETLQMMKFLLNEIEFFPSPLDILCFRTAIVNERPMQFHPSFTERFLSSSFVIVEICSKKTYSYQGFYLHHLAVDKRHQPDFTYRTPLEVLENFETHVQTKEEIENDILEIQQLCEKLNKSLIVVSHFSCLHPTSLEPLSSREELIDYLTDICQRHSIPFVNPKKDIFSSFLLSSSSSLSPSSCQNELLTSDLGHYTSIALDMVSEYFSNKLLSLADLTKERRKKEKMNQNGHEISDVPPVGS